MNEQKETFYWLTKNEVNDKVVDGDVKKEMTLKRAMFENHQWYKAGMDGRWYRIGETRPV